MIDALRRLGGTVLEDPANNILTVMGLGQQTRPQTAGFTELFIANSGTTIRFLTAALSAWGGTYVLCGVPRMHQRPIGDLTSALAEVLDGSITPESPGNCPPVRIDSKGWRSGQLQVRGNVSSQFLSGLMMAAPISGLEVELGVIGELVSVPYVEMTASVMRSFGAHVELNFQDPSASFVHISRRMYCASDYSIEPDASAASYFWAAAAITGGTVTVHGLSSDALQGDVKFCEMLERMGCHVDYHPHAVTVDGRSLQGIDCDMQAISDTVQTLAVVALFAKGPTRVRGVAHNRFKETDRIRDLAVELRKLGAEINEHEDGLTIHPLVDVGSPRNVSLATYHDHRMAMSFSLAGLVIPGIRIENPACTSKTYPEYFYDLEKLLGRPHFWRS
jgi:3-phosphoshikimate 1-carboxyvinyltransferase